ncbi:MAG: O-antigen ligase family protein [Anaerolineae bacterium]
MTRTRSPVTAVLYFILALFALLGMGALNARQAFLTRGIPDGLPQPVTGSGVQPGLNVALNQYDDAELAANLRQIASLGVTQIKQSFYFDDPFDWQESDRLFAAAAAEGLTLVPLLDGRPTNNFTPIPPDQFAAWAGEFAARYKTQVRHYLIWDEPNLRDHWGGHPPNAIEYAGLLNAAAHAIRAADGDALIVAAPLAPTVETGPRNIADWLYLQQLIEAGAAPAFDIAAGKPYGFKTGPDDRRVEANVLNFSHIILMRQVLQRNGLGEKGIWAGNWGWNALPPGWDGQKSIWGETTAGQQAAWTAAALTRAQKEWPWMGVMFLENWEPDAPSDDPHWGFSWKKLMIDGLKIKEGVPLIFNHESSITPPGFHPASPDDPAQTYIGGWEFSPEFGADISQPDAGEPPDRMTFRFWGTDVGLRVKRADFRARLYVTVDGRPANALPRDENGTTLVLTSPGKTDDYVSLEWVARNLPPGAHTLEIVASRGWDQWALRGFSVAYHPPDTGYRWGMAGLGLLTAVALFLAIRIGRQANWGRWGQFARRRFDALSDAAQLGLTAAAATVAGLAGWFTWAGTLSSIYRRWGDGGQLLLTAITAVIFYVSPLFIVYLAALAVLFVLVYLRPAWGLALVALVFSFTVESRVKPVFNYNFSPTEIFTLLTFAAAVVSRVKFHVSGSRWPVAGGRWHKADTAVLLFLLVATLSLPFTERLDVATNEWRVLILEPALFYFSLRLVKPTKQEMWVIFDAFLLGGLLVAGYGLWQLAFDRESLITAEEGLLRLKSYYGSPNNVALFLGRVLPVAAAVALLGDGRHGRRRLAYGLAVVPLALAVLFSFSKGGMFLGLPAAALFIFWRWQKRAGRRTWPWLMGFGVAGTAVILLAGQIPALAGRFDLTGATGVFRVNLWRASLNMVRQHPWFGVGLDNFLYAYRGRYIFDAAWQEPNLSHPHNILLDFATRLGLLGLLAGGWLIWQAWRTLWRQLDRVNVEWQPLLVGLLALLVDMLAHGWVDHSFFLVDLAFVFYLVLGTAVWLEERG